MEPAPPLSTQVLLVEVVPVEGLAHRQGFCYEYASSEMAPAPSLTGLVLLEEVTPVEELAPRQCCLFVLK